MVRLSQMHSIQINFFISTDDFLVYKYKFKIFQYRHQQLHI